MTEASRGLPRRGLGLLLIVLCCVPLFADSLASDRLTILGASLAVETTAATAGIDIPFSIQTSFSGLMNEEAPVVPGLVAAGELTGPGLDEPVRMTTAPGHAFRIPGLPSEGVYTLQNIRLEREGDFVGYASPSIATITVADVFRTELKVRRLTAEEMRARGIMLDATNYEVYEYTFQFVIDGETVEIPYPVIIDTRTREIIVPNEEKKFILPEDEQIKVPRWDPPRIYEQELVPEIDESLPPPPPPDPLNPPPPRPSIPAAIVIPNEFAVLHQFFSVIVAVSNGAPAGSAITLDSVTAKLASPPGLRVSRTEPAVSFGSAVPIVDAENGVTFLVAQAGGEAEYILEGLESGLHSLDVEINATYRAPGQPDIPLRAGQRASIVIHDPRFNLTFSHPDTIRDGVEYSTFTFVTNMSGSAQSVRLSTGIPICPATLGNVCQPAGSPEFHEMDLEAGATEIVEYRLVPSITGHVFATAGSVGGDAIAAAVELSMGVSESGIPLSPATLVMPWYARYVDSEIVEAARRYLGLAYGLASAPLNKTTAQFPRVSRSDIFRRAVDIARAGQRRFIGENEIDALIGLSLDLLGNRVPLAEYDELRRKERSAAEAAATQASRLSAAAAAENLDEAAFALRYAETTVWRQPHFMAMASASTGEARPLSLAIEGVESRRIATGINPEESIVRELPWADVNALDLMGGRYSEIAQVGRWDEDYVVVLTPLESGPVDLQIVYPSTTVGEALHASFSLSGSAGIPIRVRVIPGFATLEATSGGSVLGTAVASRVAAPPLKIIGARQDLHLDDAGHKVSLLFNRPVAVPDGADLLEMVAGEVQLQTNGITYEGSRPISAAAIQEGDRIVDLTFDHSLHLNASYTLDVDGFIDRFTGATPLFEPVSIGIDNDRPAAILYGSVLAGNGDPIPGSQVKLSSKGGVQYDTARQGDAAFLFEYVPKDSAVGYDGSFRLVGVTPELKATSLSGTVRLPGQVTIVNLSFLGRGSAQGQIRYDDGTAVPGARVTIGSTMFDQFRSTTADQNGFYSVVDLPVGPLTFTARDDEGNVTHAAKEITAPGEIVTQNLEIFRQPFPGTGTVRGIIIRSDDEAPVAGSRVGVYTQGFGLIDAYTGTDGRFEFEEVPAGFITILGSEWSISRQSIGVDFDLVAGQTRDVRLILEIARSDLDARVEGIVLRESIDHIGDPSHYVPVAEALVQISGMRVARTDTAGRFAYDPIPADFGGRPVSAWDPVTLRIGKSIVPTLAPGSTHSVTVLIPAVRSDGKGTLRIRLIDAFGQPVSGYRVLEPGYPPLLLVPGSTGEPGVYEIPNVSVNRPYSIWAVPPVTWDGDDPAGAGPYGDQWTRGTATLEFDGQTLTRTLRLPGEGEVSVSLRSDIDLIGDVSLKYPAWDEASQGTRMKERVTSTSNDGAAGSARFEKVPASLSYTVSSLHPTHGYAAANSRLEYQNDSRHHALQLSTLSAVSGVVLGVDGITPIAGAVVRLSDGRTDQGSQTTSPDGAYRFDAVGPGTSFTVSAETTQNGVYRVGRTAGHTPENGGPVSGVDVLMKRQGTVNGAVVYKAYKVFDPFDPGNNVPDDTPADLRDNARVPLAKFHMRELSFPSRHFGRATAPLTTDGNGEFQLPNLFEGDLRASAWDGANQELRGDWSGSISVEGEQVEAIIAIGGDGVGEVSVSVVDPNLLYAPVANVEVMLRIGSSSGGRAFDVGITDGAGQLRFSAVPAGIYNVTAFSKSLGRFGESLPIDVVPFGIAPVQVDLEFSATVSGDLVDPEAANLPVGGAGITLRASQYSTLTSTGSDGRFLFDGVREGSFTLEAKDTGTNRRATASRSISKEAPEVEVRLELENTSSLFLSVVLPADDGSASSQFAPAVETTVQQRNGDYVRTLQGNPIEFPGLFHDDQYEIDIRELGGLQRTVRHIGRFPAGSEAAPLSFTLQAYGDIRATVIQSDAPAAGVTVRAGSFVAYTDESGNATLRGLPISNKPVSVQARTIDGRFSASGSVVVDSQSTPATIQLELGNYASATGSVEAELGGPSIGTRVRGTWSGGFSESRTDSSGRFTIVGIPATAFGLEVNLFYYGLDDETIGARQSFLATTASKAAFEVPSVRLDATPPFIRSVYPEHGAQNVSPDSALKVIFSEPLAASTITTSSFSLRKLDGGAVGVAISSFATPSGGFVVQISPVAGSPFPLASNTLYTLVVDQSVTDLAGLHLDAPRAVTFRTTDYTEPRVQEILPDSTEPVQAATTFEIRFTEPVDADRFASDGSLTLQKIDAPGEGGAVLASIPGSTFFNPEATSLFFGPSVALETESFYRLQLSGIADEEGNALAPQTFHFYSWDATPPFVTLVSPNGAQPIVSGVQYFMTPDIRDGSSSGNPSGDVERVDWYRFDGGTAVYQLSAREAPFSYRFVAPENAQALELRAVAWDFSGNRSNDADISLEVTANLAPANVEVLLDPSAESYANRTVAASISFDDEGLLVAVQLGVWGRSDGEAWSVTETKEVTRALTSDAWKPMNFSIALSSGLDEGSDVTFLATVTDSTGQSSEATSVLTILDDDIAPILSQLLPAAEKRFERAETFEIESIVRDDETGVRSVTFRWDDNVREISSTIATPGPDPGTLRFSSGPITAPTKNVDTRATISATAEDFGGNASRLSHEIVWKGVNDPSIPTGAWSCPVDRAVIPAETSLPITLRVLATDDIEVTSVSFRIPGHPDVPASRVGDSDYFEARPTISTPASGETLVVTALINDADEMHLVELPVTLEAVTVDVEIPGVVAITPGNAAAYEGKTLLVRGTGAELVTTTPLSLANLIVVDGGEVRTTVVPVNPVSGTDHRVSLTFSGSLYVDCASSIDVSGQGYLGGWGTDETGARNDDRRGRTLGNTNESGSSVSASHGGYGSYGPTDETNAPYGSITEPVDPGAGGAGRETCCTVGGAGGGAIGVTAAAGTIAIGGRIAADGVSGVNQWSAGAAGSILLRSSVLVFGAEAEISAKGGDDDAGDNGPRGAGGGRIAIHATDRLDLPRDLGPDFSPLMSAHGGRNGSTASEGTNRLDGGAGTIFVQRPRNESGELVVSSFDPRFPTSSHRTRPTPVAENLTVDKLVAGPRALIRIDSILTEGDRSVDPSALVLDPNEVPLGSFTTIPATNTALPRDSSIELAWSASSVAGIMRAEILWSLADGTVHDSTTAFPVDVTDRKVTLEIPSSAPLGEATLQLQFVDRAERVLESAVASFDVVDNTAPVITDLSVDPNSLEVYPGATVGLRIEASDDVSVASIVVRSILDGSVETFTRSPETATAAEDFAIMIPPTASSASDLVLEISVSDGFPDRLPTTQSVTVAILDDVSPPVVEIIEPNADQQFLESSTGGIPVRALVTDAEVGVVSVAASVGESSAVLTSVGGTNEFTGSVPFPPVSGETPIAFDLSVAAHDYAGNSGSSSIPILIEPFNSPDAPVLTWACGGSGAMYPAGWNATLTLMILGNATGDLTNGVTAAELRYLDAASGDQVVVNLAAVGSDLYEATISIPMLAAGESFEVRAVATNLAGLTSDVTTSISVIDGARIESDMTITADDRSIEGETIIVEAGTLTIDGPHVFERLVVLGTGRVTHTRTDTTTTRTLDVTAGSIFVACNAAIDVTGRGYAGGRTWPNVTTAASTNESGGSHGGRGGFKSFSVEVAEPYGLVMTPDTPGGGGGRSSAGRGGGVIRLRADQLQVDGELKADGESAEFSAGAGGSIWIDTGVLSGSGRINAEGGLAHHSGGGGRIAIWFEELLIEYDALSSAGQRKFTTTRAPGASGTIYLRKIDSAGSKIADELVIDNADRSGWSPTLLASQVSGTVTAISGLELTLSHPVARWIEGSWLELYDSMGSVVGRYEIEGRTDSTVTIRNHGSESPEIQVGLAYRQAWWFDRVSQWGGGWLRGENLGLRSEDLTLATHGEQIEISNLRGRSVELVENTNLTHPAVEASEGLIRRLDVEAETLLIDSTSRIDVTGRGYAARRTWPNTTVGASTNESGGSHGGRGGFKGSPANVAASFGHVMRPDTPGGAGGASSAGRGGGVVRLAVDLLVVDGEIRANGENASFSAGAGGSVFVEARAVEGSGEIHADGGFSYHSGGGGRIAIWSEDLQLGEDRLSAAGQRKSSNASAGSAGTIHLRNLDSIQNRVSDKLIVDNAGRNSWATTELASLKPGTIITVNGEELTLSDPVAEWIEGSWIELYDATDTLVSEYEIISRTDTTVMVELRVGESQANAQPGNRYRTKWRFSDIAIASATLETRYGLIESANPPTITNGALLQGNQGSPTLTISLVRLTNEPSGSTIEGDAGAVTDVDTPITVVTINTRTAQETSANAAVDGSFTLAVGGIVGDSFVIRATDSHRWPLTSPSLPVSGQIAETSSVASVSVDPTSVEGGATATGTVTLAYPAVHGAKQVALTSSDPAIAGVPSHVVVPEGSLTEQFTVTTNVTDTTSDITITADFVTSVSTTLSVEAAPQSEIHSVTLSRTTAWPNETIEGMVELTGPAPSGGATIPLSSSDADLANVTSSIVIADGLTYELFEVSTGSPGADQTVTVSGVYGATRSADLDIRICDPMPPIAPSSSNLTEVWFDDSAPAGSVESGSAMWTADQLQSGVASLHFPASGGERHHDFSGDPSGFPFAESDALVAHVLVNPCNPPGEIILEWSDGVSTSFASWGADLMATTSTKARVGPVPPAGKWIRLEVSATELGLAGSAVTSMALRVFDGEAWFDLVGRDACRTSPSPPFALPHDEVWLDEPAGSETGSGVWSVESRLSGASALELTSADVAAEHRIEDLDPLALFSGDDVIVWVLVDPCDPPSSLLIDFFDGAWGHEIFWGDDLIGGSAALAAGPLPGWGEWVRLEIPVDDIGLGGGSLTGLALRAIGGRVTIDRVGVQRSSN